MEEIDVSNVEIKITDTPKTVKPEKPVKTVKPVKSPKTKTVKKSTYANAKSHIIAKSIDALYIESINNLVVKPGAKPITDAHDIGAALYYSLLYYAPDVPVEHPLTYLIMAGFGCSFDIMKAVKDTGRPITEASKYD